MSYKIRKFTAVFLALLLCFSASACGKKLETVEEYGGHENAERQSEGNSSEETDIKTTTRTLREVYGEKVNWTESVAVSGMELKASGYYEIPDKTGIGVYEMGTLTGFENEQEFADDFFDDGAKKLEEIRYINSTKYITMLSKYRQLISPVDGEVEGFDVIDSSFKKVYNWYDDEAISIHMYEGTYNGVKYGLILSFNKTLKRKYIFFDPIDITEYFTDEDYLTVMYESGEDEEGNMLENECTYSKDEVMSMAQEFIRDKIHLTGINNNIKTNHLAYTLSSQNANEILSANYMPDAVVRDSITSLVFSDSDYVSTYKSRSIERGGDYRGISILGEQVDLVRDYHNGNSEEDFYDSLYNVIHSTEDKVDAHLKRDGLAVYLCSPLVVNDTEDTTSSNATTGMIKFTSKGFYGCDLNLGPPIEDEIENVELLDFEKIKEAAVDHLEENLGPEEVGIPNNVSSSKHLYLDSMKFTYSEVIDEKTGAMMSVPTWGFYMTAATTYMTTGECEILINALDGSMISFFADKYEFSP
ncbi:MAG: hypothetical protein J5517_00875 [Eubacterium sp.]|nr:hypothetical protein [Eubacterium sp.]